MLITRSDDGYFGLRQSLSGVFSKAVSSRFDDAFEEHGLTEDGKTVAPTFYSIEDHDDGFGRQLHVIFQSVERRSPSACLDGSRIVHRQELNEVIPT